MCEKYSIMKDLHSLAMSAIVSGEEVIKESAMSFIHIRNTENYEGMGGEPIWGEHPEGWEGISLLNCKALIIPIVDDEAPAGEITCFFRYGRLWFPCVLTPKHEAIKTAKQMVEVFVITHNAFGDQYAMDNQDLVNVRTIESAETVLRVPTATINFVLENP